MAHAENLSQLYAHLGRIYGRTGFAELRALANVQIEAALASVLKVAAIGLAFDPLFSEKTIDTATIPHAMAKAWNLAFPNRPIESLNQRSTESVQIVIHGWKSKLFASEVTLRLNKGEWIGLLQLEPGQCVEPFTPNPRHRWRLRITAPGPIQLPAIDLINRIYSTLKRYPEQSMIEFGRHPGNASPTPLAATDDHSVSTLPSVVIPDLLGETAHILARNRSDLATTPLFDTLADELAQCLPRLNADQREKKKTNRDNTKLPYRRY